MKRTLSKFVHYFLLLALAVAPLYGVSMSAMAQSHNAHDSQPQTTDSQHLGMSCCDAHGGKGNCHGSTPCQSACGTCMHYSIGALSQSFYSTTYYSYINVPMPMNAYYGIVPPVEIRPPRIQA
ncbi:hypothetical protein [Sulfuriflexus mobilis]|uniref:hypothetical protein n=1 Tax=Sulfuriflexus mobilis TaxID=1811807 RepID=UPI000F83541D|nr:hypothetical protein [Sulfuriflexus mobilis]